MTLGETRKYLKFTPQQKLELVMASWRGERSIAELCRASTTSASRCCGAGASRRWRPGWSASPRASGAPKAPSSAADR
jgi:transposase-like protein